MKMMRTVIAAAAVMGLSCLASSSFAAEAHKMEPHKAPPMEKPTTEIIKTIVGTVGVTKDDKGRITGITLTTADSMVYTVVDNDEGKQLAGKESGKKVEAKGTVTEKDGKHVLTAKSFKEVVAHEHSTK